MNKDEILKIFYGYLNAYFGERNLEKTLSYLSKNISGFGSGADELINDYQAAYHLYKRDIEQAPAKVDYFNDKFDVRFFNGILCIIEGQMDIHSIVDGIPFTLQNLRMSIIFEKTDNQWLIVNLHISVPYINQKELESYPLKELIDRNLILEKTVEERTKELNTAIEKLSVLNTERNKFFSIIAHDLRSPFLGLIGYSELLEEDYNKLSDAERKKMIRYIFQVSQSSFELLENLLYWSKIQLEKLSIESTLFNLNEEIGPTIKLISQLASRKDIILENCLDENVFINADKNLVLTVIRNLLFNAVKFTNPKGKVTINSKEMQNYFEISISDSGIGISSETLDSLFQIAKTKSTAGTTGEKGTGFGLLLCKEIIEKLNGRLLVKSEIGKGSRFSFTLPK